MMYEPPWLAANFCAREQEGGMPTMDANGLNPCASPHDQWTDCGRRRTTKG